MGNWNPKYFEKKKGSLEQSILDLWQESAKEQDVKEYVSADGSKKRVKEGDNRLKGNKKAADVQEMSAADKAKKKAYQDKHGGREHGGSPGEKRALGYGSTDHQGRGLKKGHKSGDKGNYGTAQARKNDAKTGSVSGMAYDKRTGSKNAKLADLRRKRDALKKEREKLAASFDAEILELDNLLESLINETNKNDKSDDGEGLDAVQPKAVKKKFDDRKDKDIDNDGDVDDSDKYLHKRRKAVSKGVRETWEEAYRLVQEKSKVKEEDEEDEDEIPAKKGKTATGKKPDEVEMNPDMEEGSYGKKKK